MDGDVFWGRGVGGIRVVILDDDVDSSSGSVGDVGGIIRKRGSWCRGSNGTGRGWESGMGNQYLETSSLCEYELLWDPGLGRWGERGFLEHWRALALRFWAPRFHVECALLLYGFCVGEDIVKREGGGGFWGIGYLWICKSCSSSLRYRRTRSAVRSTRRQAPPIAEGIVMVNSSGFMGLPSLRQWRLKRKRGSLELIVRPRLTRDLINSIGANRGIGKCGYAVSIRIRSLGLKQLGTELNWSDDSYERLVLKSSHPLNTETCGKDFPQAYVKRYPLESYVDHWPLAQITHRLCKKKAEKVHTNAAKRMVTAIQEAVSSRPIPQMITVKKKTVNIAQEPTTSSSIPRRAMSVK
ncbi:hypothetical protein EV421DRAFT_1743389 [Armillaria borealis]|uniref:Uncharacterized protein n=1 Tax=Armillaria borealis TaxID=47425 RepID=A0AA39IXU3_9AGAR|nr:hypothetical protein EV421DRAFT_1743389 [Armillaria borealis]